MSPAVARIGREAEDGPIENEEGRFRAQVERLEVRKGAGE